MPPSFGLSLPPPGLRSGGCAGFWGLFCGFFGRSFIRRVLLMDLEGQLGPRTRAQASEIGSFGEEPQAQEDVHELLARLAPVLRGLRVRERFFPHLVSASEACIFVHRRIVEVAPA